MSKILLSGLLGGAILFGLSYLVLFALISFAPALLEEYYNPVFWPGSDRAVLFFLHPFILSFALAWFWHKFKGAFTHTGWRSGLEMGALYAVVATLPSMWITFSAIMVSLTMVLSWFAYGFLQASVCGLINSRLNP